MAAEANRRDQKDVRKASRGALRSLFQTYVPPPPETTGMVQRNARRLLNRAVIDWLWNYVKVAFTPRHAFPRYTAPLAERPGIFPLPETCTLALAGDWGSGTQSASRVRQQMQAQQPDVTIHLGDIYYSGTPAEVEQYFLGPQGWYRGPQGSYALNANHEMYSGGEGYFQGVLEAFDQQTSYFCLENDYWRVVALDTGYYAKIFPFLELLVASKVLKLHRAVRDWLAKVVFADPAERRPVILLSHHQWFSAFDSEYKRLGRQLQPYLDRVVLWYWGHEHRFAAYGAFGFDPAPRVRGRCIGHGGMPVELAEKPKPKRERNLVVYDARPNPQNTIDNDPIGYCGYTLLTLQRDTLVARYYDETGTVLLAERWTVDQATQQVKGDVLSCAEDLTLMPGKHINDLV